MRVSIARGTWRRQARGLGLAVLLAGTACGVQTRTEMSDFDDEGRPGDTYSVKATVIGKERAQLDRARALARDGDYPNAIATLTPLHGRHDLDPKLQQDILMTLGEMHAAPLNAQRDDAKARTYLEELLRDFPESEHADRARKLLDEVSH